MQDHIAIPTCFFSSSSSSTRKLNEDIINHDHHHHHPAAVTRSGQSAVTSIYRTKVGGRCRLITVTWCRNNLLQHGLSVSIEGPPERDQSRSACKVELKPWLFWRRHGSKRLIIGEEEEEENDTNTTNKRKEVTVVWDLKAAKFQGGAEPDSDYFVAVICDDEVILLLGDMKKDGYKKTGCRPALTDPTLVTRKEHVFAKRKFSTRAKFHEKGKVHEISIECNNNNSSNNGFEPEMEIRLDGQVLIHVKHLQWKFRGNESIFVNKLRVEFFWDVHDWLFSPGLRHALFIFKPVLSSSSPPSFSESMSSSISSSSSGSFESFNAGGSPEFCLFIYAWKVESEKNL